MHCTAGCPAWDHALRLYVCCDDPQGLLPPCAPCQNVVWRRAAVAGSSAVLRRRLQAGSSVVDGGGGSVQAAASQGCGRELGRYMTPYRRAALVLLVLPW